MQGGGGRREKQLFEGALVVGNYGQGGGCYFRGGAWMLIQGNKICIQQHHLSTSSNYTIKEKFHNCRMTLGKVLHSQ